MYEFHGIQYKEYEDAMKVIDRFIDACEATVPDPSVGATPHQFRSGTSLAVQRKPGGAILAHHRTMP